jgi:glucose/arabinose dehydrogenase
MKNIIIFPILFFLCLSSKAQQNLGAAPITNLVFQPYKTGFYHPVGIVFDVQGNAYVWEKDGVVKKIDATTKNVSTLLDISQEVLSPVGGDDHGLLGFALDPDFSSNGYIYLWYVVDPKEFFPSDITSYDMASPTQARCTRYTLSNGSVVANSRTILLGGIIGDGPAIVGSTHGVGSCLFGADGTLILSVGDGSLGDSYGGALAQSRGFITATEKSAMQFRAQLDSSLSGKILRINKSTGNGISSNPFYDVNFPRSAKSRTFVKGLRNPFRVTCVTQGVPVNSPGKFLTSETGENRWEKVSLYESGNNGGWPYYEAFELAYINNIIQYPLPANNTTIFNFPIFSWGHATNVDKISKLKINNIKTSVSFPTGVSDVTVGNASTGNTFYPEGEVPDKYQHILDNIVLVADYTKQAVIGISFQEDNNGHTMFDQPKSVFQAAQLSQAICLYTNVNDGYIYAVSYSDGAISKLVLSQDKNPVASIKSNTSYLSNTNNTVNFYGNQSYDPDNLSLSYLWNFGDGTTSTLINPIHTYIIANSNVDYRNVSLVVTNSKSQKDSTTAKIQINNNPPVINTISIKKTGSTNELESITFDSSSTIPSVNITLNAAATDDHTNATNLTYSWTIDFHHNNHIHYGSKMNGSNINTQIVPEGGCNTGSIYWIEVNLEVTDENGAVTKISKPIYQTCNNLMNQMIAVSNPIIATPSLTNPIVNIDLSNQLFYQLQASASSGLNIAYTKINDGPIDVDIQTGKVTFTGALGSARVALIQIGNDQYNAARPIYIDFNISGSTKFSARSSCNNSSSVQVSGGHIIGSMGDFNNYLQSTKDKVFDNDSNTFFDAKEANGQWAGLDFGSPIQISCIKYRPRYGWANRMQGGKFQISSDSNFTNPITIYTIPADANLSFVDYYITSDSMNGVSARYFRYLSPDGGWCNVAGISLFTTTSTVFNIASTCVNTNVELMGTIIGTYSNDPSNNAGVVFNYNINDYFEGQSADGQWVGLDFGSTKKITCVNFTPRNGWGSRMQGGKFQISADATFSNPVTLYTIPNSLNWTTYILTANNFIGVNARYFRYLSPNGGYGNISEMHIFGNSSTGATMKQTEEGNIEELLSSVVVFPVPAIDKILVSAPSFDLIVSGQIFDVQGRLMQQYIATGNITTIDISNYPSGMYIMKVALKNGDVKVQKFTKN